MPARVKGPDVAEYWYDGLRLRHPAEIVTIFGVSAVGLCRYANAEDINKYGLGICTGWHIVRHSRFCVHQKVYIKVAGEDFALPPLPYMRCDF